MAATVKKLLPPFALDVLRSIRRGVLEAQQRAFDQQFGVYTRGAIPVEDLDVDEARRRDGNDYEATPRAVFDRMLRGVAIDYERFTFIDIGSGKGAVLLYASHFPFKRIVGVEYSEHLCRIAERNVTTYRSPERRCGEIMTLNLDATDYMIPEEPVVLYFFNPFRSEMMHRFLARVETSLQKSPRELIVMAYHPEVGRTLEVPGWLKRVRTGWNFGVYRSR